MKRYSLDEFVQNCKSAIIEVADSFEHAEVFVKSGHSAVIIDRSEYEMLQQAIKLCEEHPSWLKET